MFVYSIVAIEVRLEELDNPKEVLKLVNNRFRAILSLERIIISVYNNDLSSFIRKGIENHR